MPEQDRRSFLKLSTAGAAATAIPARLFAAPTSPATAGQVRGWTTSPGQLHQPIDAPQWKPWRSVDSQSIALDPSVTFQDILGFGGAFTDGSCFLFGKMSADARHALLEELYGASGLNLSVGRTTIGASDYSVSAYTYDDTPEPDPDLTHFSIDHDRAYILPTLKEARAVNPNLFLFGSPWTPPGWMKASKSLIGGNMRDHYFPAYAQYFVRYLQGYAAAGVRMDAVTVQNEVDTDQDSRMPQCLWGEEYERKFVAYHLGPAFAKAGIDTRIWVLDHNYNLQGRVIDQLSEADFFRYVDGIAWHGYVGTPDAMTHVHNLFPSKSAFWTEGGPNLNGPAQFTNWAHWGVTMTGILRNWCRAIVSWNLLLDEEGKPNIGPFQCAGVVTQNSKTGALTRSGQYHAFAHFSKHLQRGARIFASTGEIAVTPAPTPPRPRRAAATTDAPADPGLAAFHAERDEPFVTHLAAQNPDGSRVLILTNPGVNEQKVQVTLGRDALDLKLPADSVTTLAWS